MDLIAYLNSSAKYSDKVARAGKELPTNLLVLWSADCAESVLHIYETAYPNDFRPRGAIEAASRGDANAAANAAYAANAAANAAAYAAYAAAYAANAAAYAAANAAYAANAAEAEKAQKEVNIKLLMRYAKIANSDLYAALA